MPQALDLAVPELCFGAGSLSRLPDIVRKLGMDRPSLLIVDPGLAALAERANGLLNGHGLQSTLFTSFGSDPWSAQIDAAAQAARQARAGAVIGIGGGSALDVAKLAAAVAAGDRGAEDYALCRAPLPAQALPCVLLPTTAGTGSEATRTAVFTTCEGAKVWAWGPELRARVALLDPELTCALPRHLTVATGLDALVHAMEAVTSRRAHAVSDAPALQAIRLVRQALPRALEAPEDLEGAQPAAARGLASGPGDRHRRHRDCACPGTCAGGGCRSSSRTCGRAFPESRTPDERSGVARGSCGDRTRLRSQR